MKRTNAKKYINIQENKETEKKTKDDKILLRYKKEKDIEKQILKT